MVTNRVKSLVGRFVAATGKRHRARDRQRHRMIIIGIGRKNEIKKSPTGPWIEDIPSEDDRVCVWDLELRRLQQWWGAQGFYGDVLGLVCLV